MGSNNFDARKRAKNARKKQNRLDTAVSLHAEGDVRAKRDRKRRGVRRLCKGMCYQNPVVTSRDKDWNAEDDGEDEAMDEQRPGRGGLVAAAAAAADVAETGRKRRRSRSKQCERAALDEPAGEEQLPEGGRQKMSTAVRLLTPQQLATLRGGGDAAEGAGRRRSAQGSADGEAEMESYNPAIQRYMRVQGFAEPTEVQRLTWQAVARKRSCELEVVAETGSGKTLAFLLAAAARLADEGHGLETMPTVPPAVVLCPTRELALQTAACARPLRRAAGLRTVAVYGGADKEQQVEELASRPHLLVATPGRLLDLADCGAVPLAAGAVSVVVLDEADKMLGLGLGEQLDQLRGLLLPREEPGTCGAGGVRGPEVWLFSATLQQGGERRRWFRTGSPTRVQVSPSASSISRTITQVVQVCAEHKKPKKLLKHLAEIQKASGGGRNPPRVLVFANHIKTVRFLHQQLAEQGWRVVQLHGSRSQEERLQARADFASGKAQVMVASDVAARGLDIRGLPYVVNYDFPSRLDVYIHRVGRTGRLAAHGHALSFITRNLAALAQPVTQLLQFHDQAVDPNLLQLAAAYQQAQQHLQKRRKAGGEAAQPPSQRRRGAESAAAPSTDERSLPAAAAAPRAKRQAVEDGEEEEGGTGGGERVEFVPSRRFCGARKGFAFKKGALGQGYYLDGAATLRKAERRTKPATQRPGGRAAEGHDRPQQQQQPAAAEPQPAARKAAHAGKGKAVAKAKPQRGSGSLHVSADGVLSTKPSILAKAARLSASPAAATGEGAPAGVGGIPAAVAAKRGKALPGRLRKKMALAQAPAAVAASCF